MKTGSPSYNKLFIIVESKKKCESKLIVLYGTKYAKDNNNEYINNPISIDWNELFFKPDPFFVEQSSIINKAIFIHSEIDAYRQNASYISELHKQDLLYYGIIDLVKDGNCGTKAVLKNDYKELENYMQSYLQHSSEEYDSIKKYARSLFKPNDTSIKKSLKEEKKKLRESSDDDRMLKKTMVKFGKLLCAVSKDGSLVDWLYGDMTESEYTTRFVTLLIDLILKPYLPRFEFKPGEQKLLMIKEYENNALLEEYSRLPGPNIDAIIKIPKLNLNFVLVEVSGPPCAAVVNYNHYKGDRNKIAKKIKCMLKVIICKKGTFSFRTAVHLKLFAIHFYKSDIYVYSISILMWDIFVFTVESHIKIPVEPFLFPSTVPKFMAKLFSLGEKIGHFTDETEKFFRSTVIPR